MQPNDLLFQYQMRGQQMQYLDGDALAHAIDQRDRDLEDYLGGVWRSLPFTAPWANYDPSNGWQVCQYRKLGDVVQLRGLAAGGSISTPVVATLPAGFRPPASVLWATVGYVTADVFFRLDVDTGGNIYARGPAAGTLAYLCIAGQFSVTK